MKANRRPLKSPMRLHPKFRVGKRLAPEKLAQIEAAQQRNKTPEQREAAEALYDSMMESLLAMPRQMHGLF